MITEWGKYAWCLSAKWLGETILHNHEIMDTYYGDALEIKRGFHTVGRGPERGSLGVYGDTFYLTDDELKQAITLGFVRQRVFFPNESFWVMVKFLTPEGFSALQSLLVEDESSERF